MNKKELIDKEHAAAEITLPIPEETKRCITIIINCIIEDEQIVYKILDQFINKEWFKFRRKWRNTNEVAHNK